MEDKIRMLEVMKKNQRNEEYKAYIEIIKNTYLCKGIADDGLLELLECVNARIRTYKKHDIVYDYGDSISSVGIVLRGSVSIIKEDFWGNRSILSKIGICDIFAETYAIIEDGSIEVSVVCDEDSTIVFMDLGIILSMRVVRSDFHYNIISNLLRIMAEKNLMLTRKMEHMVKRTTKEKVLSYLSSVSKDNRSTKFNIPYNRQQLADYLSVDRSALSAELSKLKKSGKIDYKKNMFELKRI